MSRSTAFTLIELLVVISIIAILAGMLLPAISMVKTSARSTTCASSMRQLSLCVIAYAGDNEGQLPVGRFGGGLAPVSMGFTAGSNVSWYHPNLVGSFFDGGPVILDDANIPLGAPLGAPFRCPEDRIRRGASPMRGVSYGITFHQSPYVDVAANLDPFSQTYVWKAIRSLGAYGKSSSVMFLGETHEARFFPHHLPSGPPNCPLYANDVVTSWAAHPSPNNPMGRHKKGINLSFLDGHVSWVADLTAETTAGRILHGNRFIAGDF
jgi:prepilin-type N-terminal cleavage/methylation domain-containing protein/prepilin-type processing-associated H-X9-DG protein